MEKASLTEKFPNPNTRLLLGERAWGWGWGGGWGADGEGGLPFVTNHKGGRPGGRETSEPTCTYLAIHVYTNMLDFAFSFLN